MRSCWRTTAVLSSTVRAQLNWQAPPCSADALAAQLQWPVPDVDNALQMLGVAGLVGFDLVHRAYFHRVLPFDLSLLEDMSPRLADARALLREGAVHLAQDSGPLDMTSDSTNIIRVVTIVVPVTDQQRALDFYVGTLGMRTINDFVYPSGERWLEVTPADGSAHLCLVAARPERPAGVETGIVLMSADVLADHAALRAAGVDCDDAPLPVGEVVWWSGAPLAGQPTQFRFRDHDGNSFLLVAALNSRLTPGTRAAAAAPGRHG